MPLFLSGSDQVWRGEEAQVDRLRPRVLRRVPVGGVVPDEVVPELSQATDAEEPSSRPIPSLLNLPLSDPPLPL